MLCLGAQEAHVEPLLTRLCLLQICEAFGANRYPFPEEPQRQRQMNAEVTARLRELHTTVDAGMACFLFKNFRQNLHARQSSYHERMKAILTLTLASACLSVDEAFANLL